MRRSPPSNGLSFAVHMFRTGFRTGGVPWVFDRIRRELRMPTTALGRKVFSFFRVRPGGQVLSNPDDRQLYAFYDLAVGPITFDFLWFLAAAEVARRASDCLAINVIIVPGLKEGLRQEQAAYEQVVTVADRHVRVSNILLPACTLLPAVSSITLAGERDHAEKIFDSVSRVFPATYEPDLPIYANSRQCIDAGRHSRVPVGSLRATAGDLVAVERWLRGLGGSSRIITITVRQYGYMPARNSNLAAWVSFARSLDRARFTPVFVPDVDQTLDGIPAAMRDFPVFSEAAWNIGLRMALYERAYLNLGVNNGPMGLCWLNERTRYVTFKMLTEGVPQTDPVYLASLGFEEGRSLPFSTAFQKLVWEDDSLPVIQREFEAMCRSIDDAFPLTNAS